MAKRPLLSSDELRQLLRYEPDTGKLFWRERVPSLFRDSEARSAERACAWWNTIHGNKEALCCATKHGYLRGKIFSVSYMSHRVIWAMMTGDWVECIDHIDGISSNNRWHNLRSVTHSENMRNSAMPKNNTSGHIGVYWSVARKRWRAVISDNGRKVDLGVHREISAAVAARKAAERRLGYHENHGTR